MDSTTDAIAVLHVDDDPDLAGLAATFLEREDGRIEVTTAADAAEGLEVLARADIDCVVSDYDMPGRNGIEFLEAVREDYPDLPFILHTGKGSEEVASDAISAGVTDYLQKEGGTDQYAILANRITNAVRADRTRRRAARHERINTLIRDVNRRLVEADTVEAIERAVCETLAGSEPYRFAWIGEHDPEAGEIVPRASAGGADAYLDEVTIRYDETPEGAGPGGRAARTRETQLVQDIPADPSFEPWREVAERYGYESVIVLPLVDGEGLHGVLPVYADSPNAFDGAEREVLEELAETISEAIEAAATRRRLRRRERDLRRSEERYRTLLEEAPVPVFIYDLDGEVTYANDAAIEFLNAGSEDRVVGKHATDFAHGDEEAAVEERLERLADGSGSAGTAEREVVALDGEVKHAVVKSTTVPLDGGPAIQTVAYDITPRRRRERTLEGLHGAAEPLLLAEDRTEVARRVVEAASGVLDMPITGCWLYDESEGILEPVATTEESDELLGDPPVYRRDESLSWEAFEAGETKVYEDVTTEPGRHNPETEVRSEIIVPIGDHGVITAGSTEPGAFDETDVSMAEMLAAHARAVLDRAGREEELERQNERLEEFASVASHDLRNPLNVAAGRLELARDALGGHRDGCEAAGEAREHLASAARAHDRMEALIGDLLRIAREGEAATDLEPVDLAAIVERCWNTVGAADAALEIETERRLRADPGRLSQLLENLLRNAVEHGSTGSRPTDENAVERGSTSPHPENEDAAEHAGPDVTVTVGDLPGGFYLEDDGPGIPEDERDRIFEGGYTTTEGGTGLGLSIAHGIAHAHGWEIEVTDGTRGGARFEITGLEAP